MTNADMDALKMLAACREQSVRAHLDSRRYERRRVRRDLASRGAGGRSPKDVIA